MMYIISDTLGCGHEGFRRTDIKLTGLVILGHFSDFSRTIGCIKGTILTVYSTTLSAMMFPYYYGKFHSTAPTFGHHAILIPGGTVIITHLMNIFMT